MNRGFLLRHRHWAILLLQGSIVAFALVSAYALRFDFAIPRSEMEAFWPALWLALLIKLPVFGFGGLGQGWSRFVGMRDVYQMLWVNLTGSTLFGVISYIVVGPRFPRSVYVLDFLLCFLITSALRCSARIYYEVLRPARRSSAGRKRVLVYGAGSAGALLVQEIRQNPRLGYDVKGFLDDDPGKAETSVLTVPILGSGREAAFICARFQRSGAPIDEVVIAIPSASGKRMREVLANCRAAGVPCKTIPGVGELLEGRVLASQIRDVSLVDLLGREQVSLDETVIRRHLGAKNVMVTGAGGSIGSEICRQVARFGPSRIVLFDQAESDLFRIQNELRDRYPDLAISPCIGDIREYVRVDEVIREHEVESIFHAAAYKHVPMMEAHVLEAARNNILGTRNLVLAAHRNHVADFLMISSDKAVNPTNVMGATKRVAELIVSSMPLTTQGGWTKCVSVRFGNVLGSNGSVVPVFKEQIAKGGPVTVTHPEMRRFFMTIPEAVQLVLQASTMGHGSEIFVLDMGEPVRIVDLARNMIRLSGREPEVDIEIRYTGLRPGEKLFEEIATDGENILSTYHEKIKIFGSQRLAQQEIEVWIERLELSIARRDVRGVIEQLCQLAPEYAPSAEYRKPPAAMTMSASAGSAA